MDTPVSFQDVNFLMHIPKEESFDSFPGGNVQKCIFEEKVWAKEETSILSTILNLFKKGVVVDIGANTGYFSFIALSKGCEVIAVEANKVHTPYFMKTMALNNFPMEKLTHYEMFVSSSKKDVAFDGWTGHEKILNTDNNIELVKTIALEDICDECLFLKIDVEGFEPDVIKSAGSLISEGKIPYIMFEISYIIDNEVDIKQIDMLEKLNEYGYNLYEICSEHLSKINSISEKVSYWNDDYFNNHKKHSPELKFGGANLLAVHKNASNPFTKDDDTLIKLF
jgi:FkbM family methyltransferase